MKPNFERHIESFARKITIEPFEEYGDNSDAGLLLSGDGRHVNAIITALLEGTEEEHSPYPMFAPRTMHPEPGLAMQSDKPDHRVWRIFTEELHAHGNSTLESLLSILEKQAKNKEEAA